MPRIRPRIRRDLAELLRRLQPVPAGPERWSDDPPQPPAALAGRPVRPRRPDPALSASLALDLPEPDLPPDDAIGRAFSSVR